MLNVGDRSVPWAIDAGSSVLIIVEPKHWMIENVEGIHAELKPQTFHQWEVFQNRGVGIKCPWPAVTEDADIA